MSLTRFLWRNRQPLTAVAVLAVACLFVFYQFALNESAHVRMREDMILLEHAEHNAEASHLYQRLVLKLPNLPFTAVIDDLERMAAVTGTNTAAGTSFAAKYHAAVRRELEQRASRRLPAALKRVHQSQQ